MKIEIYSIRPCNNGNELAVGVKITHDAGEETQMKTFYIFPEYAMQMKLSRGEIDSDIFDALECEDEKCRAIEKAVSILSFGSNSLKTLKRKLVMRGFSEDSADFAANYVLSHGFVNEKGDVKREVETCLRKGWGKQRILSFISSKGYGHDAIGSAEDVLQSVNFVSRCAGVIEKKYGGIPDDPQKRQKIVAALARYGYSLSEIKSAMAMIASRKNA